jgi:antitoxin VapB
MPLHIRDDRALKLARRLADRKGVTMTQAVVEALETALEREQRPLSDRLADIAREARRLAGPARGKRAPKQEIDDLWGNK